MTKSTRRRRGFLYCIEHQHGFVKLGFSTNPYSRLIHHQHDREALWPHQRKGCIRLIAISHSTHGEELDIHKRFAEYAIPNPNNPRNTEWYKPRTAPIYWFFSRDFMVYDGMQPYSTRRIKSFCPVATFISRYTDLPQNTWKPCPELFGIKPQAILRAQLAQLEAEDEAA